MSETIKQIRYFMTNPRAKNAASTTHRGMYKTTLYLLILLAVVLVFLGLAMGVRAFYQAPQTAMVIESDKLSASQYHALKQAMGEQASGNYFTSDLHAIRDKVMGLGWVDEVSVSRDWQRGIVVHALPKQAVAYFGSERVVDAKGHVYVPVNGDPFASATQPIVTIQGDASQAAVIMQQLQQVNSWFAPLDMAVVDLILTPRMTWLIRFDNGLRIIVDNDNTAQKLLSLSRALSGALKPRLQDIQAVDLRYQNGFAIAWQAAE